MVGPVVNQVNNQRKDNKDQTGRCNKAGGKEIICISKLRNSLASKRQVMKMRKRVKLLQQKTAKDRTN